MKITDIHRRCKEKLDVLYVPIICAIGAFLWNTAFANHFQSVFFNGYLNRFGITANYPIKNLVSHSQISSTIILFTMFIFVLVLNYGLKQSLIFFLNKYDSKGKHKIIKVICYVIYFILNVIVVAGSIVIYTIYTIISLNYNHSFFKILEICLTLDNLWYYVILIVIICSILFIITAINITSNNINNNENKANKFAWAIFISIFIFSIPTFIFCDMIISSCGKNTAEMETSFPAFKENNRTYVVIATMIDNRYLVIDKSTITTNKNNISKNKRATCQIKDLNGIILTEISNPLR